MRVRINNECIKYCLFIHSNWYFAAIYFILVAYDFFCKKKRNIKTVLNVPDVFHYTILM